MIFSGSLLVTSDSRQWPVFGRMWIWVVVASCYFSSYFNRLYSGGLWVVLASCCSQWLLWIFVSVFYVFLMGDMLK